MSGIETIKPLKETPITEIAHVDRPQYLINKSKTMGIKIPKGVRETLRKMDNENIGILSADCFVVALSYRREADISESLRLWSEQTVIGTYYPDNQVNKTFSKYLRSTLLSPLLNEYFKEAEVKELIHFFAKCPHGYKLPDNLVMCHAELKPVTT